MLLSLRCWWELCAVTGVGHVPPSAMQQTQPNTPSLCYERTVPGGLSGRVASSLPSISAVSSFLLPCLWVRLCHSWPLLWPLGFWHQSAACSPLSVPLCPGFLLSQWCWWLGGGACIKQHCGLYMVSLRHSTEQNPAPGPRPCLRKLGVWAMLGAFLSVLMGRG